MRVVSLFGIDVATCGQQRDVSISGGVFGEQGYVGSITGFVLSTGRFIESACECEFDADDRLDAELFCCLCELHDSADVVVVGDGQCVQSELFGGEQQIPRFRCSLLKRIIAMSMQLRVATSDGFCVRGAVG